MNVERRVILLFLACWLLSIAVYIHSKQHICMLLAVCRSPAAALLLGLKALSITCPDGSNTCTQPKQQGSCRRQQDKNCCLANSRCLQLSTHRARVQLPDTPLLWDECLQWRLTTCSHPA
jgi:hypothetical protein